MALAGFPYEVYLYGSGSFARDTYVLMRDHGVKVEGVIELSESRIGLPFSVADEPVQSARLLLSSRPLPVVLGLHNPYADIHAIGRELTELGTPAIWTALQVYGAFKEAGVDLPTRYWLAGSEAVDPIGEMALDRSATDLNLQLADEASRECLAALHHWRTSGDWQASPHPRPLAEQYCPPDIPIPTSEMSFVDAGAFIGDTVENLLSAGFSFREIVALEPDARNLESLVRFLNELQVPASALAVGASNQTRVLRFTATGDSSSGISELGDEFIQVQRLDDILVNRKIDYVKMDIEGAEREALEGLSQTLSEQAPALAISVYHRPSDIVDIPELLSRIQPRYRFYLRTYGQMSFDTVLYAIAP